jgi:hypothetical protein
MHGKTGHGCSFVQRLQSLVGDVWEQSEGRLRWICTLPLLSMPDALDQLSFAKENGACGIFMRPP